MVEYQWGIFWADLNPAKGSEQSGRRPVLVISVEVINQVLPIVTILSITSVKDNRRVYPTEVYLKAEESGLSKDSIIMAHQIRAVSKERLGEKCGVIADVEIRESIRNTMRLYLEV